MVLISREHRRKVFEYLLTEGVIVIKKEFTWNEHQGTSVPNIKVWMLLRSLHSKGVVDLVFNWRYYYYYVKDEGLKFLRDSLGIVEENIVPLTFKKTKKDYIGRGDDQDGEDRPRRGRGGRGRGGRGRGFGRGRGRRDENQGEEVAQGEAQEGGEVQAENYE